MIYQQIYFPLIPHHSHIYTEYRKNPTPPEIVQTRIGVTKDLWHKGVHTHISGKKSQIRLYPKRTETIEDATITRDGFTAKGTFTFHF